MNINEPWGIYKLRYQVTKQKLNQGYLGTEYRSLIQTVGTCHGVSIRISMLLQQVANHFHPNQFCRLNMYFIIYILVTKFTPTI